MTKNKVEIMKERIYDKPYQTEGVTFHGGVNPHKLAEVLVEMEERIGKVPIEHCGVEDCPECNKEAFKSGYLAALEDAKEEFRGYGAATKIFDDLKKKYE